MTFPDWALVAIGVVILIAWVFIPLVRKAREAIKRAFMK